MSIEGRVTGSAIHPMAPELERLRPQNGDVILLRGDYSEHVIHALSTVLKQKGLSDVTLFCVGRNEDVQHLDEQTMREHGWVRAASED